MAGESVAAISSAAANSLNCHRRVWDSKLRRPAPFLFRFESLHRGSKPVAVAGDKRVMEEHIEVEGNVVTVLPGTMFRVELDNKHQVLAHISGKMRKRFIRLTVGDRVKLEMSPYDLDKARITYRLR